MSASARPQQPLRGMDVVATVGATILLYVVGLVIAGTVLAAGDGDRAHPQLVATAQFAVTAFAMLGAVYLVLIRFRGLSWADIGFVPCDPSWYRRAVQIAVLLIPAIFAVAYLARSLGSGDSAPNPAQLLVPRDFSWFAGVTVFLYAGILVPIAEEMVFRGVLYRWLRDRLSWLAAAALSAAAFAILHQQIEAIAVAFGVGMILAWLYERSGSLLPSVLLHQTVNSVQLGIIYLQVAARGAT